MSVTAESLPLKRRAAAPPIRRWALLPLLLLVGLPLVMLALAWLEPQTETWEHLRTWLLPRLIGHTLLMLLIVGLGVALIGIGMAWLSACCEYPGRRWLDPLLVLPLAFPTYVLAFIYLGVFDFSGPLQSAWRAAFDTSPSFLEALSRPGGVLLVMVLAFYPYVYLLARASFATGGLAAFEAGRSLGVGPLETFWRVALPIARPAIVAGLALALMETLADFGAVSIYGYDTFTTAIYRTWFGLFNLPAAVQLASILMLFVFVLLMAERFNRDSRPRQTEKRPSGHRIQLTGLPAMLATGSQLVLLSVAVLVPLIQLLVWAWPGLSELFTGHMLRVILNTMVLGLVGALAVVFGGILLLLGTHRASRRSVILGELAALGYAIPGTVLAVAIMLAFIRFDQWAGTALAGGLLALILAYLIRFVRVAWGPLEAVAARIRPEYLEVARSLGVGKWQRQLRVNLPLLWPGLVTAFLLALVEIAKEMPATLMLRPFGWDTLAIRIYELTAEGQWQLAAGPSLVLVILGAIPVVLLIRRASLVR
ncbi:ABC transporter permease [Wenzhouxiangella marina]|uniref:Binding-protein-dependent transport systems inner membrane component n=1 Tax=Wenzhouxiangella marina TaxID=1579979 RepID=A0A0K0XSV6_9GAMM|nr:iron ABC transporter permease [Wenzhouxiangella marina]AKS40799.1 Binding-protein-dependent transport systems inner membrane component [Wenzhouxiangella marina]MBB6087672.1 iron(III) transport system permease protein [Wenzhouxiangella marina]